jgi:hypothetical protein
LEIVYGYASPKYEENKKNFLEELGLLGAPNRGLYQISKYFCENKISNVNYYMARPPDRVKCIK